MLAAQKLVVEPGSEALHGGPGDLLPARLVEGVAPWDLVDAQGRRQVLHGVVQHPGLLVELVQGHSGRLLELGLLPVFVKFGQNLTKFGQNLIKFCKIWSNFYEI
mgnify:CR=1 FL=1